MKAFHSVHEETVYLRTCELDPSNTTRLPYYLQLMQEAAANHSKVHNLTIPDLLKINKTWLISRQRIEINRYPTWPERITIQTWVFPPTALVSPRAYSAYDSKGSLLFEGLAYWCVLDLTKGRPVPIKQVGTFPGVEVEGFSMGKTIGKPKTGINGELHTFRPQILYRDTDINGHVNNNTYTEWCLESIPVDIRKSMNPSWFEIHYLQETYIDDKVEAASIIDIHTGECRHTITAMRETGSVVVCKAASLWANRTEQS